MLNKNRLLAMSPSIYKQRVMYYMVYSVKVVPLRHVGVKREWKYSSYSFLTSALDEGEWPVSRRCRASPPGKGPPVPNVQEAGWGSELIWTKKLEEKSFALGRPNFECL
jgi:hypothetical protein